MFGTEYLARAAAHARPIRPGAHAMVDYLTVGGLLMLGWRLRDNPRVMGLVLTNAGVVLAASMMTDHPGGVVRKLASHFTGAHHTSGGASRTGVGRGEVIYRNTPTASEGGAL